MKTFTKFVTTVCVGYLTVIFTHEIGYRKGVKDVLKANNIDKFVYTTKQGDDIVYHK